MIKIPQAGRLMGVEGVDEALAVEGITGVELRFPGSYLMPVPDGGRYLGFVFASATSPLTSRPRSAAPMRCSPSGWRADLSVPPPPLRTYLQSIGDSTAGRPADPSDGRPSDADPERSGPRSKGHREPL